MKINNSKSSLIYQENITDLLSDILTKIQEMREEFVSELDDLEDMISESDLSFIINTQRR